MHLHSDRPVLDIVIAGRGGPRPLLLAAISSPVHRPRGMGGFEEEGVLARASSPSLGSVRELLTAVKEGVPDESPSARYPRAALDEAMAIKDKGTALGKLLDLFLFGEVRSTVEKVLGANVSNGNGG